MRSAIVNVPVVFGGTFDPIHLGHVEVAKSVSKLLGDVRVRMMLAGNPRLRKSSPETIEHRWRMLQIACADEQRLVPDDTEMHDKGATRTIETIEKLGGERTRPVIWVLGDDAAVNMASWIRYETIPRKASVFIQKRTNICLEQVLSDFELVDNPVELAKRAGRIYISSEPVLNISATIIRTKISQRKPVDRWVHSGVLTYIIERHLYQA